MITLYITCKDEEEAKKISKQLLEKRLIACANIFPIQSMYWWKGKIEENKEFAILAKTKEAKYNEIEDEIKKLHDHEVPCIVAFEWKQASESYKDWVNNETS